MGLFWLMQQFLSIHMILNNPRLPLCLFGILLYVITNIFYKKPADLQVFWRVPNPSKPGYHGQIQIRLQWNEKRKSDPDPILVRLNVSFARWESWARPDLCFGYGK